MKFKPWSVCLCQYVEVLNIFYLYCLVGRGYWDIFGMYICLAFKFIYYVFIYVICWRHFCWGQVIVIMYSILDRRKGQNNYWTADSGWLDRFFSVTAMNHGVMSYELWCYVLWCCGKLTHACHSKKCCATQFYFRCLRSWTLCVNTHMYTQMYTQMCSQQKTHFSPVHAVAEVLSHDKS